MIRVAHIITGLDTGGAERMLLKLLTHMDRARFSSRVYSLIPPGLGGAPIEALGVSLQTLGMRRDLPNPLAIVRLAGLLRENRPDVIQTWMYHADLVGGVAAKLSALGAPVVWNIRHSTFDPDQTRRRTAQVARICAVASRWVPHTIICCSIAAEHVHASLGYDESKIRVIPNGFDLSQFRPDPAARQDVRSQLGIPLDAPVIGRFGRFDPQKDYQGLVDAAARLHRSRPDVHFVLCGLNIDANNTALTGWIEDAGLTGVCHLLGYRRDVARVMAALDIAASSSSYGEAFPNVLAEAMACAVPCVATDVGDSAYIVGDAGTIVPPRDPAALAAALDAMLARPPEELRALSEAARRRVDEKFALPKVIRQYEDTYEAIVNSRMASRRTAPVAMSATSAIESDRRP
jgi:glycosyltransferase involved in cell wall biosynthesis